ncbi:MAG: hypothetical protein J6S26_03175, partial [Solobacterium sp.]|nr:hypothetical protein [Solobacterium sp.]
MKKTEKRTAAEPKNPEEEVYTGNARSYREAQRISCRSRKEELIVIKQILRDDAKLSEKLKEIADAPEPVIEEYVQPKVELEVLQEDEPEYRPEPQKHTEINIYKKNGRAKELKTLDELKVDFRFVYQEDGVIYQKDIMNALERLDMSDDDLEMLWEWFSDENIIVSEDEDIEELEDDDIDLLEDEDEDDDDDEDDDEDDEDEDDDDDEDDDRRRDRD